jgi:hypothetical protein
MNDVFFSFLLCSGVLLPFVLGIYVLAFPDRVWKDHEKGNRARGITNSERTPEWERSRLTGGVFLIIMGIVLLFVAIPIIQRINQPYIYCPPGLGGECIEIDVDP